jgi:hypothetical protein
MKNEFTMQTIGISISILQVVTSRIKGSIRDTETNERQFYLELKKLRSQSTHFDEFMRKSCALDTLESLNKDSFFDSKSLWNLSTFLPFAYA